MRNFPGADKTFLQFLNEVRENTLQAFQNQQYPFGHLLEKLGQMKEVSRNPLFDVELAVQNMEIPGFRLEGLRLAPYESYTSQISQVDVALYAAEAEAGDTIHVNMFYCTALFKRETIERFIASFKEILSAVLENRNLRLKDIHIVHDFAEVKPNVYQGESLDFDF
jgi:non-ribosomal peptide synthetase component F